MKSLCTKYVTLLIGVLLFMSCSPKKPVTDINNDDPIYNSDPRLKAVTDQIKNNPKNADLYAKRGMMMEQLKMDSLAIKDLKTAISIDSNIADYYSAIGEILFEHKDLNGSVEWLRKAIVKDPTNPKAHLKIAKMFLYSKAYPKAFEEINVVLKRDVYNPEAYFLKGMVYKDMKDTAHAISTFETAVQVAPDYKDAAIQLGLLYSAKNDPTAIKYLDNAYRLDSSDVTPIFARGVYFQNHNQLAEAKQEYRRCMIKNTRYVDAYFNMGLILMQQDSVEKAYRMYDLATKVQPDNPTAYYDRGVCNERMKKIKEAVIDYKRSLALDTSYASPKMALKNLGVK